MRAVGLEALRDNLRDYVRLAESGETVLVTERDRVVAELNPPREVRNPGLTGEPLAEAAQESWITPPALVTSGPPPRVPVASVAELLRELAEDRSDR